MLRMPDAVVAGQVPESLPLWNLDDLYPGRDSAALQQDLASARTSATKFQEQYKGKLAPLDAPALAAAIKFYEQIDETLSRVMSYAQLVYAGDMADPEIGRFYQDMQEKVTAISTDLLFFALELNRLDDSHVDKLLADQALAHYRPWLEDIRIYRPHQLSDDMEQMLHERQLTGRSAWMRLFDESVAGLRFPIRDQIMTSSEALNLLSDRDPAMRRDAAHSVGTVFKDNIKLFALITNTLAKDKEIDDRWRKYPTPATSRHLSNQVEEEVVAALVGAVKDAYPRLSHRYYALKAKWLGKDQLDYWDRNAPLPADSDRQIAWRDAEKMVMDAYRRFSPTLADIAEPFFSKNWIDVPPRPGKSPGAFAHPTVPSAHPYLLLNYHGKTRDVMTLAHELGHGVHQVLAADQGHLLSATPLTLAETASVFGEMLTFRSLLDQEQNPGRRKILLAGKVEDMLNTVVRQIAFYDFEQRLHHARREQELTADDIGDLWMAVQTESLGPALRFDDLYRVYWAYIPHFIHSPFYVYAYAFGDCLVNALYAVYQDQPDGFEQKYLDLLRAGGSKRHQALLAPFGLNAADPHFWSRGLRMIEDFVTELEQLPL